MNKLRCVIAGFPDSYSEYGKMSINIIEALIAIRNDIWEIQVVNTTDPTSSMGFIDDNPWLQPYVVEAVDRQPEIWIQLGDPHTFLRHGILFNIGISAANATDVIARPTIDGINRMDLMLTVSDHSYNIVTNTVLEYRNNVELQVTDKVSIPVSKITLGVNSALDTYTKSTPLSQIKEDFCFIYNGNWGRGYDVNNVSKLIYTFFSAFQNSTKKPALILKTNVYVPSVLDATLVQERIASIRSQFKNQDRLPNVYLINGNLTDTEMMGIYNNPKVKVMVTASSNEQIGLNLKEFQLTGKPILTPAWGSQTDLGDYILSVDSTFVQVDKQMVSDLIVDTSKYVEPNLNTFGSIMLQMYNQKMISPKIKTKFKSNLTKKSLDEILSKHILNTTKSNYIPEVEEFEL